jgi:hypothetical protein
MRQQSARSVDFSAAPRHKAAMRAVLLLAFCLAACGEPVAGGNAESNLSNLADTVTAEPAPVRIGDLGPNFDACPEAGTTRHLGAGETLPVRSSPFDNGVQTGAIPAGAQFFVCTRSIDQKWYGLVFSPNGRLAESCGVSEPSPVRKAYSGPCRSGWVASTYVKLIAGDEEGQSEANAAAASPSGR